MEKLKIYSESNDFAEIIHSKLPSVPTIGDPAPTEFLYLFHYSKDKEIQSFHRSTKFCWTSNISDDYSTVGVITGLKGVIFEAMYIIRIGVGASYKPRNHECDFMSEWALDIEIKSGKFTKIILYFDSSNGVYKPI